MSSNLDSDSGSLPPRNETPSTSSSLIERARRREGDAWDRITGLYGPMVYSWCRRCGLQADDAADTVQDVFLVVIEAIAGFRGGRRGAFRAWLRTITRNKIHDGFRQATCQAAATGGSSALQRLIQTPETVVLAEGSSTDDSEEEAWQCVVEQIRAELSARIWDAFWRVTADAVPASEVAEELNMSVAAVYQAKSRVLRRLRQDLRDMDVPV